MSLATEKYRAFFDASANLAGFPIWKSHPGGIWLEAICLTESSGNPKAEHFDPGHQNEGDDDDWTSYGLFQIEGVTARAYVEVGRDSEMGFDWLFRPQLNTAVAVGLLSANLARYKNDVPKALAAYNGGSWGARLKKDGSLNNQAYVDRVETNVRLVAADRA